MSHRDSEARSSGTNWRFALRALRHRNFRLFFFGQGISMIGTWMQQVALSWLVWELTHRAGMLGLVGFCGQIPSLVVPPLAGVYVDRWNRHRILVMTQTLAMIQAFIIAALVLTGTAAIWQIIPLSIFLGCVNAIDIPARQSLYIDMIEDRNDLGNAIALNSSLVNGARLIGPAIAGFLIGYLGVGMCFLVNGISYWAVLAALLAMKSIGRGYARQEQSLGEGLREGFAYVWGFEPIKALLLLLAMVSLLGMPYMVLMPVFATKILGGHGPTYAFLVSCAGLGALCGAVYLASRKNVRGLGRRIAFAAFLFGFGLIAFSLSRTLWLSMFFLIPCGFGMIVVLSGCNTILQTIVEDRMRGRIMSYYTMAFMGMVPFGALMAGTMGDRFGAPLTVRIGGVCCLAGALLFTSRLPMIKKLIRPIYQEKGIIE